MEPRLIGILLHIIIPSPFPICLILCSVPLLLPNIDSTYFIFRNMSSFLGPIFTLICRISCIFLATLHGSLLIYSCVINGANIALLLHSCLSVMTKNPTPKQNSAVNSNLGSLPKIVVVQRNPSFPENFRNYRQLQVMLTVINQVAFEALPVAIFVMLLCCISMGYIVVELTGTVTFPMTIMAIFTLILFTGLIHLLMPLLAEVTIRSLNFVEYWYLQNMSGFRRKQLRSCRRLSIWIGPFLKVTRAIRIQCFSLALYHTVSLVILI